MISYRTRSIGGTRTGLLMMLCAVVAVTMACGAYAKDSECGSSTQPHPDCGTHNMMLVGQRSAFLSHLPMFHSEHRFQAILEVSFNKSRKSVLAGYTQDRARNPDVKMYTVEPAEQFVLARLWEPGNQPVKRKAFAGAVYRGHLERGGKKVSGLATVDVRVKRVVYARELRPDDPRNTELKYILFGTSRKLYVAHQLSQAPDFDQILGVELEGHQFSASDLKRGVILMVAEHENVPGQRIKEGETVGVEGIIGGDDQALPLRLKAIRELYFEEGELGQSPDFEQTAAEREAGF
jgi:hypothetical protein